MSNLVHNEQVKLAATFWNNLGVAALLGVFLVPAFYTRHTILQQGSPSAWGSRRRSPCGWSPTGGSRGCGNELVAENQLYRNRHSKYRDGIAPITPAAPRRSSPPWPTCRAAGACRFHSLRAIAAKILELFRPLDQPPLADLPFFVGCRRVTQEVDFVTCHFRRLRSFLGTHSCPLDDPKPQLDQPADGFGARWMVLL
jgi:hypothetical protein